LAGIQTWHGLSGAFKRQQFGAYFKAQWARVTVLKDVGAIVVALALAALLLASARAVYPALAGLWRPNPVEQNRERARKALALCGSQSTGNFEGSYAVSADLADASGPGPSPEARRETAKRVAAAFATFRITHDRIVSRNGEDSENEQELCLTKVLERTPQSLHAEAIMRWRVRSEDVAEEGLRNHDYAGPSMMFDIRLDRGSELTRFRLAPLDRPLNASLLDLRREP
jgi:hypothetical protein